MTKTRDLANLADLNFDSGTMVVDKTNDRVGIGTSSPAAKLDVVSPYGRTLLQYNNTSYNYFDVDNHVWRSAGQGEYMRIDSSGNVGIGTSSPSTALDLGTTLGAKLTLYPTNYSIGVESNELRIASNAITSFYSGGHSGTERMRLTADGKVGIGTSSPTASLTVGAASNEGTLRIGDNGTYYGEIKRINASDELRIGHYGGSQKLTFHTVNAERMRIDSLGRVTMPYQPSFAASRNQSDVSSGTYVFANVYHNTGNHYSNTTGRFTAPIAGLYFFSTNMMSSNAGTYNNSYYEITKNGSGYQRVYSSNGTSVHHRWNWSGVIYLAAGDYISVDNPAASSLVLYGGGNDYTTFTGFLVG